jgi:hypothetical protein
MAGIQVKVGRQTFNSIKSAKEYVQSVISKYAIGEVIDAIDDFDFFVHLFQKHPEAQQKIGPGVRSIKVQQGSHPASKTGQKELLLERTNNTSTDISWHECLKPKKHSANVTKAFRDAIREQTLQFKRSHFAKENRKRCPVSDKEICFDNCHVDHYDPSKTGNSNVFDDLVNTFCEHQSIARDKIPLKAHGDHDAETFFASAVLAMEWKHFHENKACLRAVHPHANLSHLRKGVKRKSSE